MQWKSSTNLLQATNCSKIIHVTKGKANNIHVHCTVRAWCTCNFIWASFLSDYLALLVLFILITTNGIEILSTSNSTTMSFASRYVPMYIIMFMGMEQIVLSPISYNYSICFLHHLQYVHTQKEAYLPTFPKFWDMQSQKLISYPTVLEASKLLWKFVACT